MRAAARSNIFTRLTWVASTVPFPGRARPRASVRQFMELAVNMPEHEPQVGQASCSSSAISASATVGSAAMTMASMRSTFLPLNMPDSMGPPETNMVGILRRMVAMSMPGMILSQLQMQTRASAMWALHMYSTLSAIRSRDGREYSIPECPMAMPSSMAMVLNSAAKQPFCSMRDFIFWPISWRCTCPGTNCVKEFAMAMMGFPNWSSFMPLALQSALAPAIFLPCVLKELRNGCDMVFPRVFLWVLLI